MAYEKSLHKNKVPQIVKQMIFVRKHHGYTQGDLADMTGLSLSSIQKIENGDRYPSLMSMIALVKAASGGQAELTISKWM